MRVTLPANDHVYRENKFHGALFSEEKAVTLIELLFTLALLGFVIAALYTFYLAGLTSWNRSVNHMEYQQSVRISMDKMINEIRYAHMVEIRNGNTEMIYFKIYAGKKSTLFRFRLSANQLILEQRKDNDTHYAYNVIALGITGLSFAIDDNETVFITIMAGDEFKEITLSGSVRPLNIPLRDVVTHD